MLTTFWTTLEQMARIFLFLVIGFGLNRLCILPKGAGSGISRLITMVLLPALLIYNNMTEFSLTEVGKYGRIVLLGGVFWFVITLLAAPLAKKLSGGNILERGVYLYGLSFPNTSAVGTPVVLALLGSAGLFQFNLFMLVASIMTYAWGISLFLGIKQKKTGKDFLKQLLNPVFISMMIGLTLGSLGAKNWIPAVVTDSLGDLGMCFIPLSLLLTGYTIADYPINEVFNRPKSYIFTLIRLIIIPLLAVIVAKCVGLSMFEITMVTFAFTSPSGMNVVVFPASYGQDCKTGASIVLISSLGSLLTIPAIYALVTYLFG